MKHPVIITSRGDVVRRGKYDRNSIISQLLSSASARQQLAQSMIVPLRTTLDYQGLSRKVFQVQSLPDGALPVYDSDPKIEDIVIPSVEKYKFDAIKISSSGEVYRKEHYPWGARKVTFPAFQIYSNPTIKLSSVKKRRFNIIDRAVLKARQEIMSQEDSMIFDMLDKLSGKK